MRGGPAGGTGTEAARGNPAGGRLSPAVANLDAVLQQMPTAVVVLDAGSGRVALLNEKVAQIWRRSHAAMLAEPDLSSWRGWHPSGRRYRPEEWPPNRTLRTSETVDDEEIEIVRGDESRGVIRICSTPVREEGGQLVAAVATILDVTEQKKEERSRRFLAHASAELVSSLSYGTTLRNVARLAIPELADWCAVDILGEGGRVDRVAVHHASTTSEELGSALAQHCPRDLHGSGGVARVLRTGEPEIASGAGEGGLQRAASDPDHLELLQRVGARSVMIVPLVARGKTLGAITFVSARADHLYGSRELELARELAARAALAIDNARLYHETQAASRAKSDFLAVMSHELRTPLTAIIGYSELLELGIPEPITETQKEQVERIEISARHLQELIEDILAVASLEAGEAKIRREKVSLREMLHRAEVIIRPLAMEKALSLEVAVPEEELEIETDPEKLLQILLNLLANAVKFTEEGTISLRAAATEPHLELEVRDTGIGVEPRDQERIFEPFWQVDHPTTRRAGGTGLGLTISRRLVALLSGEIRVQSEPGKGSNFIVRIPVRPSGRAGVSPNFNER